ncbi:MAG: hypothetical protein IJ157_08750 [Clostridia bacterium]|nr:hypothetical protein [Clostridia bacterium]
MKDFLRSVGMLALLRMTADMLLPEGGTRKMCETMLGFMMTLGILSALGRLLPMWLG